MKKTIYTIAIICSTGTLFAQNNLGVDQTNPQAKVHVTNTTNQKSLLIEDEASDATPFVIDSVGNVGVGESAPTEALDVNGNIKSSGAVYDKGGFVNPVGVVEAYVGIVAPQGWLLCDGSAVGRTTYADLFAIMGIAYGAGDGSTTFNLPDLRGMFLRGVDNGAGNDPDAATRVATNGGNSGDVIGSSQTDELKSHNHNITVYESYSGSPSSKAGGGQNVSTGTTITQSSGGLETRPKNVYVNYIIKY